MLIVRVERDVGVWLGVERYVWVSVDGGGRTYKEGGLGVCPVLIN